MSGWSEQRWLGKALYSAGLVLNVPPDPWRQLAKDMATCDLRRCGPRVLPDTGARRRDLEVKRSGAQGG